MTSETKPTLAELQELSDRFLRNGGQDATYWLLSALIDIEYLGGAAHRVDMTRADIFRAVHSLETDRFRGRLDQLVPTVDDAHASDDAHSSSD